MFKNISKVFLITDMDGTLLPHSKILSQNDIDAINKFTSDGGKFSIATGRPIQSVSKYFNDLTITAPVIIYNGAAIYDIIDGEFKHCEYLSASAKDLLTDVLSKFPELSAEILTKEKIYALQKNEIEEYHIKITNTQPIECSIDEVDNDNWIKILLAMETEKIGNLISYIEKNNYNDLSFVQSCSFFYEVLPKGISKGKALKELRKLCNFDDYTIVAVGDYYNDIEMLKYADIGVATANASDDVKKIADIVLEETCEEYAIASVINYIYSKCGIV